MPLDWIKAQIIFASDATLAAFWGVGFAALALFATLAERRRAARKRDNPTQMERVGYVPWTGISMMALFAAAALALLAIKGWASA